MWTLSNTITKEWLIRCQRLSTHYTLFLWQKWSLQEVYSDQEHSIKHPDNLREENNFYIKPTHGKKINEPTANSVNLGRFFSTFQDNIDKY